MSLAASEWAWTTRATHGARLVLLALAECQNGHSGKCFPNVSTLMDMTRLGKTAVVEAIAELEDSKLVTVSRKNGCGSSYTLAIGNRSGIRTGPESEPVRNPVDTGPESEPHRSGIRSRNRKEPEVNRNSCAEAREGELPLPVEETAPKPASKPQERNPLLDALVALDGTNPITATKSAWGKSARALSEIRAVSPNVTPEMIGEMAGRYRLMMPPKSRITSTAMSSHWGALLNFQPRPIHRSQNI